MFESVAGEVVGITGREEITGEYRLIVFLVLLCYVGGAQYQRLTIIQDVEGVSEVDNTFGLHQGSSHTYLGR